MVCLATAQVIIKTHFQEHLARLLIDTGSELSFITETLVNNLNLTKVRSPVEIQGIGGVSVIKTKGKVNVKLHSVHKNKYVDIEAHILSVITTSIPSKDYELDKHDLDKLTLADEQFNKARGIDIIIGADYYSKIIKPNIIRFKNTELLAQLSIFGWLIIGKPLPIKINDKFKVESIIFRPEYESAHTAPKPINNYVQCYQARSIISDLDLESILKLFWVQEEPPDSELSSLTQEEQQCEDHFKSTHSRDTQGRYIVRIPLKDTISTLGNSYDTAHKCLQRTLRRLARDQKYKLLYDQYARIQRFRSYERNT